MFFFISAFISYLYVIFELAVTKMADSFFAMH